MDTTTMNLPTDLVETLDATARRRGTTPAELMRDALAAYEGHSDVEPEGHGGGNPALTSRFSAARLPETEREPVQEGNDRRFASLGVGESRLPSWFGIAEAPDDGYDSSNIKDWIRKTWNPE